jgi:hypothetical protein
MVVRRREEKNKEKGVFSAIFLSSKWALTSSAGLLAA